MLFQSLASKMYVPGAITPLSLRCLYFARNSGPPDTFVRVAESEVIYSGHLLMVL